MREDGDPADFSIAALHDARFEPSGAKNLSSSTVSGLRTKSSVEGDGVLQMLLWLDRSAESFVPGCDAHDTRGALQKPDARLIVRFDAEALHAALDARRVECNLTWAQVAREIGGTNASALTRLAKGGRVAFPQVMRITRWLNQPVAAFTRASAW